MTQSIPLSDMEGAPSASFNEIGDKYVGTVTAVDQRQQTDPQTNSPKFFPSGDPMMLWVITIQPENGDALALWAKGGRFTAEKGTGKAMLSAIGDAVKAAGATSLDVGGLLAVAFTGEGEKKIGMNAPKLFTAEYRPPAPQAESIPATDLFSS